jgi:hypothetical protein
LSGLLAAKNALISSRIGHEIARINLFVDLELLYLDDEGAWLNQDADPAVYASNGQLGRRSESNANSESGKSSSLSTNDSAIESDYDDGVPQPEFVPAENATTELLRSERTDLELNSPETGLKLEQSQFEIESSPLGTGGE